MEKNQMLISFSSRENGNCAQVSQYVLSICDRIGRSYSFSDFSLNPCGTCHYECFRQDRSCPHIEDQEYALLDAICQSELVYFVVPNYCDYPCANFFIFNERSNCYFQDHPERLDQYLSVPKKFLVISGSTSHHFKEAFEQHCYEEPNILFLNAKQFGKSSIDGTIMESDCVKTVIKDFVQQKA